MEVNQPVIIAGIVITGVGVLNALINHQGITRIVIGGYLLIGFLAVGDLIPGLSPLVSAIAVLAMVVAVLYEGLPILQRAGVLVGAGASSTPPVTATQPGQTGPR